jgi:hypothetical protein
MDDNLEWVDWPETHEIDDAFARFLDQEEEAWMAREWETEKRMLEETFA